ncbi:hypothetical protein [Nannocystis pusilla]|uniref:hypothetical protein n=1 Tax=Nannocystis pusilla TaxID=889268 RepID=UPI003B7A5B19
MPKFSPRAGSRGPLVDHGRAELGARGTDHCARNTPFPAQRERGEDEHQDERRNLGHDEREAGGRERMRRWIFAELGREEDRVGTGSGRDPIHRERQRHGAEKAADDPDTEREGDMA